MNNFKCSPNPLSPDHDKLVEELENPEGIEEDEDSDDDDSDDDDDDDDEDDEDKDDE